MPSLSTLEDGFRDWAEAMYDFAHQLDNRFVVTSARRTWIAQEGLWATYLAKKEWALFRLGRTSFGMVDPASQKLTPAEMRRFDILPALPPGQSSHVLGMAWDMARIGVKPYEDDLLPVLGDIWNRIGGRWSASDPVHFEG